MASKEFHRDWAGRLTWTKLIWDDINHYVDEEVFGRPRSPEVPYYMSNPDAAHTIGDCFDDVYIDFLEGDEGDSIWRCEITHQGQFRAVGYGQTECEALCFTALRAVGVPVTRR